MLNQTNSHFSFLCNLHNIAGALVTKQTSKSNFIAMKKQLLQTAFFSVLVFLFTSLTLVSKAQVLQTYTSGSGTWTCPAGVFTVQIECWGAGGAGAGATPFGGIFYYAGGGGGGAYTISTSVAVVPGNNYSYSVGAGALGTGGAGANGGNSSITIISTYTANGGSGGGTNTTGGTGGAGGTAGTIAGSAGTAGSLTTGGAGGAGAGPGAGAGGATLFVNNNGNNGSFIGGGGGGALKNSGTSARFGGNGANGQIRITAIALPCVAPTAQPTSLLLTPTATTIAGSFTPSASATNYLIIRTTTASAPTNPTNGTTYTVGAGLGGYIESAGASTSYTSTGLTPSTQYWYWVFAYNATGCSGGPLYLTASPLNGTTTTLVGCPTTFAGIYNIPNVCFPSLAAFISSLNAGTVTGAVTVNLAAGYTETAPIGGYNITQTGTATNTITFQKTGAGANPTFTAYSPQATWSINDAIFKITGADYITISGFTMQENPANTITDGNSNNNMTEFGVALFYASTTNGAQYNTIKNCIISLNKTNSSTFGIYSNVRHSSTNMSTTADISSFAGSNSYNKFYGNTISNVNMGITLIGSATDVYQDVGNDIGGTSAATGNSITGWGENVSYWSYSTMIYDRFGIYVNHQVNENVSYNTVVSGNLASNPSNIFGIYKNYSNGQPTGTLTTSITYNNISITDNFTTTNTYSLQAIANTGISYLPTATANINNNTIYNCTVAATAPKTTLAGISNSSNIGVLNANFNTVRGTVVSLTSGSFEGIVNTARIITTINVNNNQLGIAGAGVISALTSMSSPGTFGGFIYVISIRFASSTCTVNVNNNNIIGVQLASTNNPGYATLSGISIPNTLVAAAINVNNNKFGNSTTNFLTYTTNVDNGSLTPIYVGGGNSSCITNITGNDITGISDMVGANTPHLYIYTHTSVLASSFTVSNNTFTNLNVNTTNGVLFIYTAHSMLSGNTETINNNAVVGSYIKNSVGAYIYFYYNNNSSISGSSFSFTNNNFSNITGYGAVAVYGIYTGDGASNTSAPTKVIKNNTFNNWTIGTSNGVGVYADYLGTGNNEISNNTISAINGQGYLYGLFVGSNSTSPDLSVSTNVINNLTTSGASVYGINDASPANTKTIYNNTFTNFTSNASLTGYHVVGISSSGGKKSTIRKNTLSTFVSAINDYNTGISLEGSGINGNYIDSNLIYNFTNTSTGSNAAIRGIYTAVAVVDSVNIINNELYNFTTASSSPYAYNNASIVGICMLGTGGNATNPTTVKYNKIYNFNNTNTGANNTSVVGISAYNTSVFGNISLNKIYGLASSSTGTAASTFGINPYSGNWTITNNMISLYNGRSDAAALTNGMQCVGINDDVNAGFRNIYFNSINIAGSSNTGAANSVAYQNTSAGTAINVINNLLHVSRTGNGKNFAIGNLSGTYTGFTSNYNVMNVVTPNNAGATSGYASNTLSSWRTATSADMQSNTGLTVNFIDPINGDLHIDPKNICSVRGLGVVIPALLVDWDNETRKSGTSPKGPDVGADEVFKSLAWTGTTDQNWTTASNWAGGVVPAIYSDVLIPITANNPIINAVDNIQVNSVTVGAGALLTNKGNLSITDYVSGTNNLDCQAGNLIFNSSCKKQSISGTAFVNSAINKFTMSNDVDNSTALNDTLKIITTLAFGNVNSKTFNTNGNLTLVSTVTNTANLADLTNAGTNVGNTLTGKVNIERYMFAKKSWRLLATPVVVATSPSITAAWRETGTLSATGYGTQITGPASSVGMDATSQRASMKSYNGAADAFIDVTNTSSVIGNDNGYFVFVRGDRSIGQYGLSETNLRIKGDVRQGNQIFNVIAGKYQSFGNPYPSRINFATVSKTNIVNSFTIWNPNSAGSYNVGAYETYTYDISSGNYKKPGGAIRNYIESGEAVFVQSNSVTAGNVTVKETDKTSGSANVSRVGVTVPTLEINLFAKDVDNSIYLADGVLLNFNNIYSAAVDNNDVRKINNTADNLAVKNGNYSLIVERRPELKITDTINLLLTSTRVAPYRFDIDPSVLDNTELEALLIDKFLQTETAVSFTNVTSYAFDITNNALSKAADRFMIVFKQAATTTITTIAAKRNADKTITINFGTTNEKNVIKYTVEQSNDGINFTALPTTIAPTSNTGGNPTYTKLDAAATKLANWYRVKISNSNNSIKYSAIAMVAAIIDMPVDATPAMVIYPNPVQNGNINLHFDNQPKGTYTVKITNASGQTIRVEQVEITSNKVQKNIAINNLAAGGYQVIIANAVGEQTTLSMIAK